MHSKNSQWETKVCLFDEAAKTLMESMANEWKCVQLLWNLGEDATIYTLFSSMFPNLCVPKTLSLSTMTMALEG
jgi:hypothetical protein